jgi:Fic family protein
MNKIGLKSKEVSDSMISFLKESNYIEQEFLEEAFQDSLKAWEYMRKQDAITLMVVLKVHKLLLKRLNPTIAGKLRSCDVYIGRQQKKYISVSDLVHRLDTLFKNMPMDSSGDKNLDAKWARQCHIVFEDIHPHVDGNGRTGRIIYNWHRMKLGLPIDVIKCDERFDYYKWFTNNKIYEI